MACPLWACPVWVRPLRPRALLAGAWCALIAGAGCSGGARDDARAADAADSAAARARDLTLAGGGRTHPILPELHDVPATPRRGRAQPQPAPPPPVPAAAEGANAPPPSASPTTPPPFPLPPSPLPPSPPPRGIVVADSVSAAPSASPSASSYTTPAAVPEPTGRAPSDAGGRRRAGAAEGTISAGTVVLLNPHVAVCTRTNAVGDLFVATLASPILATGGLTIPAGVIVTVQVSALNPAPGGGATMEFVVRGFGREPDGTVPVLHPAPDSSSAAGAAPTSVAPADPLVGHARTEQTLIGTCVPREGTLRITLLHAARIVEGG
jgi:hypothetical protein